MFGYCEIAGERAANARKPPPKSGSHADWHPSIYNVFMIETVYKTPAPEQGKSECYVLVLSSRVSTRGTAFVFMEEHGKWDNDVKRFRYAVNSINTDEQLTYAQALKLYETAKRNLAGRGFIYSFCQEAGRKAACSDVMPEPELASA